MPAAGACVICHLGWIRQTASQVTTTCTVTRQARRCVTERVSVGCGAAARPRQPVRGGSRNSPPSYGRCRGQTVMLACRVASLHDQTTVSRPWCMNRDRLATTQIERRFTDRCRKTALFAGRSSDSGRCTRGAPLLLVLLATWPGQTLTPSAGECPEHRKNRGRARRTTGQDHSA